MMLREELVRYHRQIILPGIGVEGQESMKRSAVLVVGAGGLGCPLLLYLAAAGIGKIGIIDFDTVELSNLHRQILFDTDDIGKNKAETAAAKLKDKNPFVVVDTFPFMLNESNAEEIIGGYDIVCDGSDNFSTRYLVNDVCVKLGKPLIYGSVLRFEGQMSVLNYRGGMNLRDIFPEPPDPQDVPSCSEAGVIGALPGIIGSMMAERCILIAAGRDPGEAGLLIYRTFEGIQTLTPFSHEE